MAASSCEPKRCSAYAQDLRWRMVYERQVLGLTYHNIGANLHVDPSTVYRTVQHFLNTGTVDKKKYNSDNLPRKLNDVIQLLILQLVLDRPGIILREIQDEVMEVAGVDLAESTICQFLHTQNFSRQKMRITATQRDEALRAVFASELSIYKADMFIFMDETGSNRRDAMRRYAYSWRGKPAVAQKLLVRGHHLSAIAIMSTVGVLDCEIVDGAVDGNVLYQFVQNRILPHLMPFDGSNPHSIVVLDNASVHHVDGIADLIQGVGALVMYLPPYSPDFNPIEELFSKLKCTIKSYERELQYQCMELEEIVLSSFCHITAEDCCGWIANSGIYVMH